MSEREPKQCAETEAVRQRALGEILRIWSVDADDVTPTESGFDWLPGSHLVHVRIHEDEREAVGPPLLRVAVRTEFLRSVPVHDTPFILKAGLLAQTFSPTYSQVYPPSEVVRKYFDGRPADMDMFASAYVDEDNVEWMPGFLARMSIMQPINAELHSREVQFDPCGTPALATGSLSASVDEALNVHHDGIIPQGKRPSRWSGSDEFEAYVEECGRSDFCLGFSTEQGMSFETPFGAGTALVRFNTDQSDCQLGNGLTVETQVSGCDSYQTVCYAAAWLNYYESILWTDFPQLGRWHPLAISEKRTNLAHTIFIPNALFAHGMVYGLGLAAIERVRWAREKLLPNEKDLTMIEIMGNRFGRSFR